MPRKTAGKKTKATASKTNPVGKGTKTIGINMKLEMADELERRAKSMPISVGSYCKIILQQWIESGEKLRLEER